ncbi:MAG: hypothetical protein ACP5OH_05095, partial [Nitrososphaerota archaeon]
GNFITKWGSHGEGDGEFVDPEHLAIGSEGRVYVSDRSNDNIQVFEPIKSALVAISRNNSSNIDAIKEQTGYAKALLNDSIVKEIREK